MLKTRRFNVIAVSKDAPRALNLENPEGKMVEYNGKQISVKL
jgi:alpha-D-xyloside xylohydrolase